MSAPPAWFSVPPPVEIKLARMRWSGLIPPGRLPKPAVATRTHVLAVRFDGRLVPNVIELAPAVIPNGPRPASLLDGQSGFMYCTDPLAYPEKRGV